jgi:hypothetical protein
LIRHYAVSLCTVTVLHEEHATSVEPLGPNTELIFVRLRHLDNTILAFLPLLLKGNIEETGVGM